MKVSAADTNEQTNHHKCALLALVWMVTVSGLCREKVIHIVVEVRPPWLTLMKFFPLRYGGPRKQ